MYEEPEVLELEDLDELESADGYGEWEWEDLELQLGRRRRPVTRSRPPVRRVAATRRARPATPLRRRAITARPRPVRRPIRRTPTRWRATRRIPFRYRRRYRRPYSRPYTWPYGWRRYVSVPYPGTQPIQLPPVVVTVRPAAVLNRFYFERASLRRRHLLQIRQLARRVVASLRAGRPFRTVRLVGHTDNRGSARFNRRLGRQRAMEVRNRLIRELNELQPGLTTRLEIIVQTLGEEKPVASNRTAGGRALNRRVAIFLSRV